jgi:hypothetical protein
VIGLGHGTILPAIMAAAYQTLPKSAIPAATTAANICIRVGSAIGAAVLAIVLQIQLRHHGAGPAGAAHAFAASFWWALGFGVVALVPALLVPNPGRPAAPPAAGVPAPGDAPAQPGGLSGGLSGKLG